MTDTGNVARHYTTVVTADVYEAEPRPVPYAARESTYRPDGIQVTYRWSSEDSGQTADVALSGHVILKDGHEGRSKTERLWSRDEWPQWVHDFIAANRPPTGGTT